MGRGVEMPKINQEEYEILKEKYDMGGKWIARDADGLLYYYKERPKKLEHPSDNVWDSNSFPMDIIGDGKKLFHFVKWSDSSPYNIAELIREYEVKELRLAPSGAVIVDPFDESEGTEVKDIEEFKSWFEDDELYVGEYVKRKIDQLDEPEVLSQEWIDEYKAYAREYNIGHYIQVEHLQNLLVPKQEELESKIKVLIEAYKQEDGAYSNPENGWISGFVEDLENLVEKEPLYYALIKGHELLDTDRFYWIYDKYEESVFLSKLYSLHGNFLTEMSKSQWNELGINDSNADLIKVKEVEE